MDSYKYIAENFLTRSELLKASGVSDEKLSDLITSGCFPKPSYRVELQAKIESFFGVHEETEALEFFPKSAVGLLKNLMAITGGSAEMAAQLKRDFDDEYRKIFVKLDAAKYGLSNLFEADGTTLTTEGKAFFDQEWQHYLDGTYGVCTTTAHVREIATKEAMIAKIKFLSAEIDEGRVEGNLEMLADAVDRLDSVSAAFAPHELERSSRGKFINRVMQDYLA